MEYILSFEWLIKHPISIPFFFGKGTSFQALCGGNGDVKCRILFTSHPTKIKEIALAGHMKLWIMGLVIFVKISTAHVMLLKITYVMFPVWCTGIIKTSQNFGDF